MHKQIWHVCQSAGVAYSKKMSRNDWIKEFFARPELLPRLLKTFSNVKNEQRILQGTICQRKCGETDEGSFRVNLIMLLIQSAVDMCETMDIWSAVSA